MSETDIYTHATALVLAEIGVLVRGVSGSGKSRLTLLLMAEARHRRLFTRLIGDDRVALAANGGRLVARGHPAIGGQLERRGAGIQAVAHEPACVVRAVVDLEPGSLPRWPAEGDASAILCGVALPRIALEAGLAGVDGADLVDRLLAISRP